MCCFQTNSPPEVLPGNAQGEPGEHVYAGASVLPKQKWLDGLGRMLYTGWMKNLMWQGKVCLRLVPREKRNLSATFPLLRTKDLVLSGLKRSWAQVTNFSKASTIHLLSRTEVVTIRSFMKALVGGYWTPELVLWPLHCLSANLTSIFMEKTNWITDIVPPVMIPSLNRCWSDVTVLEENLRLKLF